METQHMFYGIIIKNETCTQNEKHIKGLGTVEKKEIL
jgi:hypothetical protein